MQFAFTLLLIAGIEVIVSFTETGALPRRNWRNSWRKDTWNRGYREDNGECDKGHCVKAWNCSENSIALKPTNSCAYLNNGPWVCCLRHDENNLKGFKDAASVSTTLVPDLSKSTELQRGPVIPESAWRRKTREPDLYQITTPNGLNYEKVSSIVPSTLGSWVRNAEDKVTTFREITEFLWHVPSTSTPNSRYPGSNRNRPAPNEVNLEHDRNTYSISSRRSNTYYSTLRPSASTSKGNWEARESSDSWGRTNWNLERRTTPGPWRKNTPDKITSNFWGKTTKPFSVPTENPRKHDPNFQGSSERNANSWKKTTKGFSDGGSNSGNGGKIVNVWDSKTTSSPWKKTRNPYGIESSSNNWGRVNKTWENRASFAGSTRKPSFTPRVTKDVKRSTSGNSNRVTVSSRATSTTKKPALPTTVKYITREPWSVSKQTSSTTVKKMATRSTVNSRGVSTTPLPNINAYACGVRDTSSITSRNGGNRRTGNNAEGAIIFPDSREGSNRRPFQRIVGGKEAEPFSWPWVAVLYKVTAPGGNRFLSAGTLINENFVLTAAHVFTPEDLRTASYVVMLGTHNAKESVAEYRVSYVLRHPEYQQRYYYHDIALLRLDHPVMFNNYVMPVCLPSPSAPLNRDEDLVGKRVTVMGWGDDSFGGKSSRVLKEATFPIVSRRSCNASYVQVASNRFPKGITQEMLCAGAPNGGKDACQGDSGGPLTSIENGRYTQVGIVSFGYKCGDKEYPGVYTKVSPYLSWIAENARCDNPRHDYDYYN